MNRLLVAISLSMSFVALGLAGFVLVESRSGGTESRGAQLQKTQELATLLKALQERVAEHEAIHLRHDALARGAPNPGAESREASAEETKATAPDLADALKEQVAVLTQRLASLEDEETIARLAQSGGKQVAQKEIRSAVEQIGNSEAEPEDRLAALKRLRLAGQKNDPLLHSVMGEHEMEERDVYLPMLDLVWDGTLDSSFRAEVVRNFQGARVEELRQPMLDLLASGDVAEVRTEALITLYRHMDDATVRTAIKQASQGDPHETVQAAAQKILPRVEHIEQRAAKSENKAGAGQER